MSDVLPVPPPEPEEQRPAAPEPEPRYPFWGYTDVLLLAALAVPLLVGATLTVSLIFRLLEWTPRAKALGPIMIMFGFYGLWFLLLFEVIRIRYGRPFWPSLAWLRPPRPPATYIMWGLLTALAAIALVIVLRPPRTKTPLDELLNDRLSVLLLGLFAVTLGPLCEELAFRGFLMPLLVRSFGARGGILLQALPFALLHGSMYAWSWQRLVPIYVAGASFGWVRWASGSTAAATYAHGAYNLIVFALGLVGQR